jgi:hypothetical protein
MDSIDTQLFSESKNGLQNKSLKIETKDQQEKTGAYLIYGGDKRKIKTLEEFNELTKERVKQIAETGKSNGQTAGNKDDVFSEGSLLRGAVEKKIFVIEKGFRKNIYLEYLHMFCGQRVWTIDDEELNQIPLWPDAATS